MKRKIALFGGSFNPVHAGHTMLADYLVAFAGFDEVWLSLAAANPLKAGDPVPAGNPTDRQRLEMLGIALRGCPSMRPCAIELSLPRPSYSITTLRHLAKACPDCSFTLVIGADNWLSFPRWREWQAILDEFGVAVYPRPGYEVNPAGLPPGALWIDAPVADISSTFVRRAIAEGRYMNFFLPPGVYDYILINNLYVTQ